MSFQQRFDPLPKFGISATNFIEKCTTLFGIVFFECFEKDCSFVHNQVTPHMPVLQDCVSKGSAKSNVRVRQLFTKNITTEKSNVTTTPEVDKFPCPDCSKKVLFDPSRARKELSCPHCWKKFEMLPTELGLLIQIRNNTADTVY